MFSFIKALFKVSVFFMKVLNVIIKVVNEFEKSNARGYQAV